MGDGHSNVVDFIDWLAPVWRGEDSFVFPSFFLPCVLCIHPVFPCVLLVLFNTFTYEKT